MISQKVKEAMNKLQPAVDNTEKQRQEVMPLCSGEEVGRVRLYLEQITAEWREVNETYMSNHK